TTTGSADCSVMRLRYPATAARKRARIRETAAVPEDYFAGEVAERYDETSADMFAPSVVEPAVGFLAGLAGAGAALELGTGRGRFALPLSARPVRVCGIDLSADMVAKLREKPGAEAVDVAIGDFATTRVDGTFSLAYIVFNTFMNLTTQDAQVA